MRFRLGRRHRPSYPVGRHDVPPDDLDPGTLLAHESPAWVGTELDPLWCLFTGDARALRSIEMSQLMIERSCDRIARYARRDDTVGEQARDQLRRIALDLGRLAVPETQLSGDSRPGRGPRRLSPYVEPITETALTPEARRASRQRAVASVTVTVLTSLAAGSAIVLGHLLLALVIMAARLVSICLRPFQPPAFPQDYAEPSLRTRLSLCTVFLATLIGHGSDVLLRGCVAVYFLKIGHPGWSVVCLGSTLVGVGGSFGRTAAATIGVRVPRNFVSERLARTVGLTVGLFLALVTGNDIYLLVLACAMGAYGAVEMLRATRRVMLETPIEVGLFVRRPFAGMTEQLVRHDLTVAPERSPYLGSRHESKRRSASSSASGRSAG
jgi:hypothetical protein